MATKQEFIDAVDENIRNLNSVLVQINEEIASNNTKLAQLTESRKNRISDFATILIADLEPASIAALLGKIPGIVDPLAVAKRVIDEKIISQSQIDALLKKFDPNKYESKKLGLETDISSAMEDVKLASDVFTSLNFDGASELIKNDYGTKSYRYGWFDEQFYRDWKRADEIVEIAGRRNLIRGKKKWNDFAVAYAEAYENLSSANRRVSNLQNDLANLESLSQSLAEAKKKLEDAPATVLEMVRVKIRSHLDNFVPTAKQDWAGEIVDLNKKISEANEKLSNIQTNRVKITEQISSLNGIRAQASRSRTNQVPEKYVDALRTSRPSFSSGRQTVYIHHDDSSNLLLNAVIFSEMSGLFHQEHHGRDYNSNRFSEARQDSSGQS